MNGAGQVTGTPATTGTANLTLRATNPHGSSTRACSLTVLAATAPPNIITQDSAAPHITQACPLPNATQNLAYSQTMAARGNPLPTWDLSAGALPAGMATSGAGQVTGTPSGAVTSTFNLRATNSKGNDIKSCALTVQSAPPQPAPPNITQACPLPNATLDATYSQTLTAAGSPAPTWDLSSGSLPPGLSLDSAGHLTGRPSAAGTADFSLRATNSQGNDIQACSLTVQAAPTAPRIIQVCPLPNAMQNTAYSQSMTATGTPAPTWDLSAGALPAGVSMNSVGRVTGTPSGTGTANFTLRATNSQGNDTRACSLTVQAAGAAPVITQPCPLPDATQNAAYSQTMTATGNPAPTWDLSAGAFPAGISMDSVGRVTGTPTGTGSSNFTLLATNAEGSATKSCVLTVQPPSSGHSYTTNFPLTEDPISQGEEWVNGKANGVNWSDVRTTPGFAFGTQDGSGAFDDSTALLTGSWAADQTASATVALSARTGIQEVELRLHSTISSSRNTGYEINFSVGNTNYIQIVRWNGPLNDFTYLATTGNYTVSNGDVVKATFTGSTITVYLNGTPVLQTTDDTFPGGNPGMGFFINKGGGNSNFGFSRFSATD